MSSERAYASAAVAAEISDDAVASARIRGRGEGISWRIEEVVRYRLVRVAAGAGSVAVGVVGEFSDKETAERIRDALAVSGS